MANVPTDPYTWSSTAGSNQPDGTDTATIDDDLRALQAGVRAALENLSSVAGTNTITATCTGLTAYATGQEFSFIPANTNTGATTINITSLGAKNIFWNGAACVGGEIRQSIPVKVRYDGTQFHIIANGFNAPFLDTHPVVQGSADSTKKVRIEVDAITTATTRVITVPDADVTLLEGAASQAQQETGSSNAVAVTPGTQHFHPSAAKGWVYAGVTGSAVVSYNVASITDGGTGNMTVNWSTDFSSANQASVSSILESGNTLSHRVNGIAAGTTQIIAYNFSSTLTDPAGYFVAAFGDQA